MNGPAGSRGMGVFNSVFLILFGIVWMSMTASMPFSFASLFSLFGLLFIVLGVYRLVVTLRDGSDAGVPPQNPPSGGYDGYGQEPPGHRREEGVSYSGYCQYCGAPVEEGHSFCKVCGKRLR